MQIIILLTCRFQNLVYMCTNTQKTNNLTINSELSPVGVVCAKVIGNDTLVASLISEVDVEKMKNSGVDQLSLLVLSKVLHFCIIQHLPILSPCCGHWWIAAAGRDAAQRYVVPPQRHRCLRVSCDPRLWEIICGSEGTEGQQQMVHIQIYISKLIPL